MCIRDRMSTRPKLEILTIGPLLYTSLYVVVIRRRKKKAQDNVVTYDSVAVLLQPEWL